MWIIRRKGNLSGYPRPEKNEEILENLLAAINLPLEFIAHFLDPYPFAHPAIIIPELTIVFLGHRIT